MTNLRGHQTTFQKTSNFAAIQKQDTVLKPLSNISMGYLGPGNVIGDADVILSRKRFFTLKTNTANCSVYVMPATAFVKFFGAYKEGYKQIIQTCLD